MRHVAFTKFASPPALGSFARVVAYTLHLDWGGPFTE